MARRGNRLDRLTTRWRERHDAHRPDAGARPRANPGREALAKRGFPYHDVTPADYVPEHGEAMVGFTYDDESYADPELDAWIVEVGRLLRERRVTEPTPRESGEPPEPPESPASPEPSG